MSKDITTTGGLFAAALDLFEAAVAGARYSNALKRLQETGNGGQMVPATDELENLFMDWHDKTHAAIAKVEGK